ncbi:MAG: ROK family protein [Clostridium butyricum]|nr:ROK family protein [Clostridium butyricum]
MKNYMVFDIGGSSVKWSVISENGDFKKNDSYKTPDSKEEFFEELLNITNKMKEEFNVEAVAISAPGAVDSDTGIIGGLSAIPYIHGPNFKEIIKEGTGLDCAIENDANCAALGECWLGAGKENSDLAFIVCGTGIGGAIVKDKKVHVGVHKHGGEFGYCSVSCTFDDDGVKCLSWSKAGSTIQLANNVTRLKGLEIGSLSGLDVFDLYEKGDEIAIKEVDKYYYIMAVGIYNIQYTYDPEVIVLGGAISEREDYIDQVNKHLDDLMKNTELEGTIKPVIKRCKYGNDANKLGALYNYFQTK